MKCFRSKNDMLLLDNNQFVFEMIWLCWNMVYVSGRKARVLYGHDMVLFESRMFLLTSVMFLFGDDMFLCGIYRFHPGNDMFVFGFGMCSFEVDLLFCLGMNCFCLKVTCLCLEITCICSDSFLIGRGGLQTIGSHPAFFRKTRTIES